MSSTASGAARGRGGVRSGVTRLQRPLVVREEREVGPRHDVGLGREDEDGVGGAGGDVRDGEEPRGAGGRPALGPVQPCRAGAGGVTGGVGVGGCVGAGVAGVTTGAVGVGGSGGAGTVGVTTGVVREGGRVWAGGSIGRGVDVRMGAGVRMGVGVRVFVQPFCCQVVLVTHRIWQGGVGLGGTDWS